MNIKKRCNGLTIHLVIKCLKQYLFSALQFQVTVTAQVTRIQNHAHIDQFRDDIQKPPRVGQNRKTSYESRGDDSRFYVQQPWLNQYLYVHSTII